MTLLRQIKVPPQDFRGVGIQVRRLIFAASIDSTNIQSYLMYVVGKHKNFVF